MAQYDHDPDRMDESDDAIQQPGPRTRSQEQKREKPSKTTKIQESFKRGIKKITPSRSRPLSTSKSPRSPSLASSSQQGNISHASIAVPEIQYHDTHQHEPCNRCDQLSGAYEAKMIEIDTSHQQELQATIQKHDEKTHDIGRLEVKIATQSEEMKRLKSELDTYDSQISDLQSSITARDVEIDGLKAHNTQIRQELQATIQKRDGIEQRIGHLMSEATLREEKIRALKHTISKSHAGNPDAVPDNQINTDYQYLISQLKNWARSNFRGSKPTETEKTISEIGISRPRSIAAINKCLTDSGGRRFLAINRLVMDYLCSHIFEKFIFGLSEMDEKFFCGLLFNLQSDKTATPKEIHFWRSTTIKMVTATKSHEPKVEQRKKEIVQELESILANTLPPSVDPVNAARRAENLRKIIDQAVELSFTLGVQRPRYFMHWPRGGKDFIHAVLELAEDNVEDSDAGSEAEDEGVLGKFLPKRKKLPDIVELVIFPALIKQGNEDGESYNESICITKGKALKA